MADEFRSGQGSIIPSMFIGLGGTGSRIVDRIAGRAERLPNWKSQLRALTTFVAIDTNELDQHKLKHVPDGNRINIAGFDKQKVVEYYRKSNDRQALHWLDKAYQPRSGVKPGAGQIRVESRLGFFYHSPEIKQRLEELVAENLRPGVTWRQANPKKYYVYVFCTLAGGTGSGSFLSTAYLIENIIKAQGWEPRIIGNLMLSTLLLDKVGPELHGDIHSNSYAALKELEHLSKLGYKQVKDEGRTSEEFVYYKNENSNEVMEVDSRPFFLSFVLDKPPHVSLPDTEAAIADASFLQVFTPIIDNLAGELDNYEKRLEGLTRLPGDLKDVGLGYTQNFGAFGAAAMVMPGIDFLEYCAFRFAAQAIRSQVTFGIDPSDSSDERARALAKLAINYTDPKFLRMADDARESTINHSFVRSVREMARQDEKEELLDGFWYQLIEAVDKGLETSGLDKEGNPKRSESLLDTINRKLSEARNKILNKVSLKERALVLHQESLNQYIEYVSRLENEIRASRKTIDEYLPDLKTEAADGDMIAELDLGPISERYLIIRLLQQMEEVWIPQAKEQKEKSQKLDMLSNTKVKERLKDELYLSLKEAASKKKLFGLKPDNQAFYDAQDEAQQYYRSVAAGALKAIDADIKIQQFTALREYLQKRSRQYMRLATQMNSLVQELENEAERYRRGEIALTPSFALRIEVLETLDEPRERIWDKAYRALFLDEGRYLNTFDRKLLAETITEQLEPVIRPDGVVVEKSTDRLVTDLRRSLLDLGRERMTPSILGDKENPGLNLMNALELEARLILQANKRPGQEITSDDIDGYLEQKFRALSQITDVFARVTSAESKALDDGVTVNRTRQLIQGINIEGTGSAAGEFLERLKDVLSVGGKQVKIDAWHDTQKLIVHDVELPIPLYYWKPITKEIENAYIRQAADEKRSYNLHIDYRWENALPNLNPNSSEMGVGWALRIFAEGVIAQIFAVDKGIWIWNRSSSMSKTLEPVELGDSLSIVLYRISEFYRNADLKKRLKNQLNTAAKALAEAGETEVRREKVLEYFDSLLEEINLSEMQGEMSREDVLDRPILRTLLMELRQERTWELEDDPLLTTQRKTRFQDVNL